MVWEYFVANYRRWTVVGFCAGAICGLVAITPGAGYVGAPAALAFGATAATACFWTTQWVGLYIDDSLDIFASHAVAGLVGNIFTGIFAEKSIAALDGSTVIDGGWMDHNWIQLAYQLANSAAGFIYSLVVTYLILWAMSCHSAFDLRRTNNLLSVDEEDIGEFAYDYVRERKEVDRPQSPASENAMEMANLPNGTSGSHQPE